MAVTKTTYTATAPWTTANLADLFRDAFIDAGLMTAWHDSFTLSGVLFRVLKVEHSNTKAYGSSFYYFDFRSSTVGISLASGWNTSGGTPPNVPTGTQYRDYHTLPANQSGPGATSTNVAFSYSTTSNIFLDRYTSATDNKQSWFVLRQGLDRSTPFSILHKNTTLHSWLDLDKGIISGFSTAATSVDGRTGFINFRVQENIARCLLIGTALRGDTSANGSGIFHSITYNASSYFGVGSQVGSANFSSEIKGRGAGFALPIGKNSANPAYTTDYIPICTDVPWSVFTPTGLADDFGVYMHYADNTIAYGDRFIVQSGVNEWEVLNFANNSVVTDGASPAFVARVV